MSVEKADIIIVGAGIIGATCAHELALAGREVLMIDAQLGGATWSGMGHLVSIDDNPAEMNLIDASQQIWRDWASQMPSTNSNFDCAYAPCGTIWVATDSADMDAAQEKSARLQSWGIASELINEATLRQLEPSLRSGLAGGLRVPSDSAVYAPNVVRWLLNHQDSQHNITVINEQVTQIDGDSVILSGHKRIKANAIVLAAGAQSKVLCPELPVRIKKGHLLITDRYPKRVSHQLIELGYTANAHLSEGTSVAFNVQPRPTGQLLIGSSRQFDTIDPQVETDILARMLTRAVSFMPSLSQMNAIRTWTGFRVASPDGLPLIGAHPSREHLWLALAHEGLGVTTAPATARLLTAQICQTQTMIDVQPYLPSRFDLGGI